MPAISVLAGMEVSGVVFLPERVTRFSAALQQHLESLERAAVVAVGGREFNPASPDQVGEGKQCMLTAAFNCGQTSRAPCASLDRLKRL